MTKVLVVVYSLTGTSRRLAALLCQQQDWEMAEIVEECPRSGLRGVVRSILDSALHRQPAIRYGGPVPRKFHAVVLVSPIWLRRLAGPMRSFVARRRDHLPPVAVISVMGGRAASRAAAEVSELIDKPLIANASVTAREIEDGTCADRLRFVAATVLASAADAPGRRPLRFAA